MEFSLLIFGILLLCGFTKVLCRDFTYNGLLGPDHWLEEYNKCGGKHQSPININILDVVPYQFDPLRFENFGLVPLSGEVLNNGHTVVVKLEYDELVPKISGGPLQGKGTFLYSQLHFHWGENDTVGSEDRIDNRQFPAELHIVFYNEKYQSFDEAVSQPDGVAVMAFFYSLVDYPNEHYEEFIKLLDSIRQPNMAAKFLNPPNIYNLVCEQTYLQHYFTYTGSLTTPPCSEDVTWIDLMFPILISAVEIDHFRGLYTHGNVPLTHNFRPVQPLNNRTVYKSIVDLLTPEIFSGIPFVDRIDRSNGAGQYPANTLAMTMAMGSVLVMSLRWC